MPSDAGATTSSLPLPTLSREALAEIYAHARETYPEECCGFLIGPRDSALIDEARRCVNEQNRYHALDPERFPRTARIAYYLGGRDLRFLMQSIETPRPVKIIYHSHIDVGSYFSAEDIRAALGREPDDTPNRCIQWTTLSLMLRQLMSPVLRCFGGTSASGLSYRWMRMMGSHLPPRERDHRTAEKLEHPSTLLSSGG